METYHFYAWVANHFVKQIPARRPVVLLIDGHLSHIDYSTTLFCKANDILLFRLPPHTSHLMQPADRGYFSVFKGNWKKECTKFSFENPGLVVTKRTFSHVFVQALDKTARPDVIKASFKCSGIWPVNRHAIPSSSIAPSKVFSTSTTASSSDSAASSNQTNEASYHSSDNPTPVCTSTPKKDDRHPILKALQQIEEVIGQTRVSLFKTRLDEGYDVADDALFQSWKALKLIEVVMTRELSEISCTKSTFNEDLCPVIKDILTYPQIAVKEKRPRKKVSIPRHMTSEAALKVLEAQDAEKRRKEMVKEATRQKRESKGRENREKIKKIKRIK